MSTFTFKFTQAQVQKILGLSDEAAADWYKVLVDILPKYNITTPERVACFLGQCAHESGNFALLKENLNYGWQGLRKVFPKYFPTDSVAKSYERKPEKIANKVYANRMGNGSEASGDGYRFRGRGLIQVTGKNNYTAFATSIKMPLPEVTTYLETKKGALESACWYWTKTGLNAYADKLDHSTITKKINGGTNGITDRIAKTNKALKILKG